MNELQNIILNSVKNPSYFQQLNINDLIDDESIKDELLNILQIIVANSTKQSNRLKNDMDELNLHLENKIDDLNNDLKEIRDKLIYLDYSLNSINNKLEANKVIETVQSNVIKIAIIEKDFRLAQNKYDKIFLDNLFMPNLISPKGGKFKNLKELLNNNYEEINKINSSMEKVKKDFDLMKENQNTKSSRFVLNKLQDMIDQKVNTLENSLKIQFKEYNTKKEEIEKKNENNFKELHKRNNEFIELLNNMKIQFEDNFNQKFDNEHKLIEAQTINIKQLKDFRKEYIKKHEKLEQLVENQKVLIQKYIRYFELYKYRENFLMQKDTIKDKKLLKEKSKKIKERNKSSKPLQKITINNENKIKEDNKDDKDNKNIKEDIKEYKDEILFHEEVKNEIKSNNNFNKNNSFEIKQNVSFKIENNKENNQISNKETIILKNINNINNNKKEENKSFFKNDINDINDNNYNDNSYIYIINKLKKENKVKNEKYTNFGSNLPSFPENNLSNESVLINMNTFNTLNYEKESTKTNENNERNEKNGKIKLKKVDHFFNSQNLRKLSINNQNNNNNSSDFTKKKIINNIKTYNKISPQEYSKIKNESNKINNISFESKLKTDNLLLASSNNANETSSHFTIDNYIENKLHDSKKEKSSFSNNSYQLKNNENKYGNLQRNKFFKLNVLKLDKDKVDKEEKPITKKKKKLAISTKFKIWSKSLSYKKVKKDKNNFYEFNNEDYVKIIGKNRIKRVNTEKIIHLSKKNKVK